MQLVHTHSVSDRISTAGGEPCANARADVQSWAAVLRFLTSAMAVRDASMPDSRSLSSMGFSPAHDVVNWVADLDDGNAVHALRRAHEKVATATQGNYDASSDADVPDLTLGGRLLVALYTCRLTPASELAEHCRACLANISANANALQAVDHGDIDTLTDAHLCATLTFMRMLAERPIEDDRDTLLRLPAAGLATADVVTLAQLIAFVLYQMRLAAGLRALREAVGSGSTITSMEIAA